MILTMVLLCIYYVNQIVVMETVVNFTRLC